MIMKKVSVLFVILLVAGLSVATGQSGVPRPSGADLVPPKYGGTLNMFYFSGLEPATSDVYKAQWPTAPYAFQVVEPLIYNDVDGAGLETFQRFLHFVHFGEPDSEFALAESWELTSDKIVYHVRKGVLWQAMGKDRVMKTREMTPDDVLQSLVRWLNDSPGHGVAGGFWAKNGGWVESVSIDPKNPWAVVVKTNKFYAAWKEQTANGWTNAIYAPENVKAGLNDWDNLVGTGPWVMDRYIQGASMNFVRNPQYWGKAKINGKDYTMPFADKVVLAVIPDLSTRIAAVRSGKLDWSNNISQTNRNSLASTNPDLRFTQFTARPYVVTMNMQSPILSKLQVRKALTMAVDRESIQKKVWGAVGYDMDAFPQLSDVLDVHTPFDQLPADIRETNTFNPQKARQLLADAGYANGFSLKMVLRSGFPDRMDAATALAQYLNAVGVKLNIEVMESTAYAARLWGSGKAGALDVKPDVLYDMIIDQNLPNNSAVDAIYGAFTPSGYNFSNYYDEEFMTRFRTATATVDADKRNAILKELSLKGYSAATVINLGAPSDYVVHQPWIRNYNGEATMGTFNQGAIWGRMWIDETARKK